LTAYWKGAVTCAMASPIGYASLKYITFPLMILTKSSKPVPVMLVGVLFYGRSYTWYKYVSVFLICVGIALFSSAKASTPSSDSDFSTNKVLFGIVLVLFNLLLDGYTNNEQDFIFAKHKATPLQMMRNTNIWQGFYIFAYLSSMYLLKGRRSEAQHSYDAFASSSSLRQDILEFCICASLGQVLIFGVMKDFGSIVWITISVTRKLFTILVSVFMFKHPVKPFQWVGIIAVFVGMILDIVMSYASDKDRGKKPAEAISTSTTPSTSSKKED